ncbi:MAG: VWA domain-containing protein [Pirellulaceae bacterium]
MGDATAGGTRQIIYEFVRTASLEGWWVWAMIVVAIGLILFGCVRYYRRDAAELNPPVRWTLILLRLTVVVALVFFFFDLQRRTQRLVTRSSEVAVLVDTSQSMSLPAETTVSSQSRSQRAAEILGETDLLSKLSTEHCVSVYAFDDQNEPRLLETRGGDADTGDVDDENENSADASWVAMLGALCLVVAGLLSLSSLMVGATGRAATVGYLIMPAAIAMIVGTILLGSIYAIRSEDSLSQILSGGSAAADETTDEEDAAVETETPTIRVTDWNDEVAAAGAQSRIGDAVRSVLGAHDPSTLAGIVLLTDGQANGGSAATASVAQARRSEVALYPVGIGSSDAPVNVRIVDLDAPRRVYPGDKFAISGVLQASGPKGVEVEVQLLDGLDDGQNRGANDEIKAPGDVIDSQTIKVASDGTLTGIRFELEPESVGRRRLALRVIAPQGDQNKRDDIRDARYEVVARKLRVLLVAGGPTREYRFVRNLLYRDKSIELDAWLQTGQPGMSQDADKVLTEFPQTPEELFEYDAIAMFDPDWTAINAASLDMLDRWLAQQAGGLVLVAGPVYHPRWSRLRTDPRVSKIAGFFPVNVSTRGPLLGGGRQGGENAWPIDFTPEARRAEFFWIADRPEESFEIWDRFGGVYDYVGIKSAKPGAKVYGYFSDPTTELGDTLPIYMASQFYGAGRVFFQASGEIWRLRGESDAYFDSYYTKLVRWVSEGRLLRDSNRGVLLVDNSRAMVGDTITVRAVLTDEQFEPLDVAEVPAKLLAPSGSITDIKLSPLKGEPRAGTYGGRFVVREAGSYEIRLTLGDALDEQVLRQSVQVRLPTIELERPKRNDEELSQYASITGGQYFPIDVGTTNDAVASSLLKSLQPQPQTTVLPGTPDQLFNERRNAILLWLIASVLTMEWVTRRLHRLA